MCPDYLCRGYTARRCKIRNLFVRILRLTLNSSNFVCLVSKHFNLFISLAEELWAISWNISVNPWRMSENSYMSDIIFIWPLFLVYVSVSQWQESRFDLGARSLWPLRASILKLLRQMKIPKDGFPARGVVRKKSIGQVALQILPEKYLGSTGKANSTWKYHF